MTILRAYILSSIQRIYNVYTSDYKWSSEELGSYLKSQKINDQLIKKLAEGKVTGRMIPIMLNLNNYSLENITGLKDGSLDQVRIELFRKLLFGDVYGKLLSLRYPGLRLLIII